MADVTGISVDIGNVIAKAQEADKAIETLAKNGIKNLNDLSDRGVKPLIEQFDKLISRLGSKSNGNADIKVNVDTSKAVNNIDEVNKAIKNINKGDASLSKGMEKEVRSSITELAKLTERVKEYEHRKKLASEGHQVQFVVGEQKDYVNNLKRIAELEQRLSEIRSSANLRGYAIGFNASASTQAEHDAKQKFYDTDFRKQLEDRGKLIEQNGLAELKQISDSVEARKKASEEAAKIAQKEHDEKHKQLVETFNEAEKNERARVKANEKATKEMIRNAERYQEMVRRGASAKGTALSSSQAMETVNYHANASSINQNLSAISALNNAKRNLNQNDKDYKKTLDAINNALLKHKTALAQVGFQTKEFNSQNRSFIGTLGQLRNALAGVFAVTSIVGYVNKLVKIRGEFELQHKSLQVLLQDKDKADALWDKTVQLAVKSPFRVKDLVTYTKQLAAYRVEADKLYETNKMLADVSAGLGVDMDRLILAFGQVKAANYLRGTELRQFSEAGINILKELADEYTRVEGRIVTVGEVFNRVSKRMVSFADVEKVFQKVTSAGGVFYKMQEKQAETTIGLLNNLKDVVDVALNDIGEANDGVIKGVLKTVTALVQQWEKLVPVIKTVGVAFVAYKLHTLAASSSTRILARALGVAKVKAGETLTMIQLLNLGMKRLGVGLKNLGRNIGSFLKGNALTIAISAIVVGIYELISYIKEYQERLKEIRDTHNELRDELSTIEMNIKFSDDFEEKKANLNSLIELANRQYNLKIDLDVNNLDASKIEDKATEIANEIKQRIKFSEAMGVEFEKFNESGGDNVFDFGVDDIIEDANDFGKAAQNFLTEIEGKRYEMAAALFRVNSKNAKKLAKILQEGQRKDESDLEYMNRMYAVREAIYKEIRLLITKDLKASNELADLNFAPHSGRRLEIDYANAVKEFNGYYDKISSKIKSLPKDAAADYVKTFLDRIVQDNAFDPIVKELMYKLANEKFKINISVNMQTPPTKDLAEWMEEYNAYLLQNQILEEQVPYWKADTDEEAYKNTLKGDYERYKRIVDEYKKGTPRYTSEYTPDDIRLYEIKLRAQEKAMKYLGIWEDKYDKAESKDLSRLKEQINLLKEMHNEYEKLNKTFSKEESMQKVLESYSDTFSDVMGSAFDINAFDFTSQEGLVAQLEKLKKNLPSQAKELVNTIQKAISGEEVEIGVTAREDSIEQASKEIENAFGQYELSMELQKLNIPPDLARQLFGLETTSLPELRMAIESRRTDFGEGKDGQKKYEELLKKLSELEDKHRLENLKKYSKYLVKAQSERVKIKLEELRQIEEIESLSDVDDSTKMRMREGVRKETQKKLSDLEWEDFKSSDMYIQLFEDLDNASTTALTHMVERLQSMRTNLKDLDASDLKEIIDSLSKVQKEIAERNPFQAFADNLKKAREYNINKEDWTQQRIESEEAERNLEKQRDGLQISLSIEEEKLASLKKQRENHKGNTEELDRQITIQEQLVSAEKRMLEITLANLVAQGKITQEFADKLLAGVNASNALDGSLRSIADIFNEMSESVDKLKSGLESIGDIGSFGGILDMGSALTGGIGGVLGSVDKFTTAPKVSDATGMLGKAGAFLGKATAGIGIAGAVASAIGGIIEVGAAIHDARIEKEIQEEVKLVDKLGKQYEKLEERIDEAYSIDKLNRANTMAKNNLEAQMDSYRKMIKLEEDKKKTDDARIKEWQEKIADAQEQLRELEEKYYEELGGFGSDLAYKDAATEFVDAWFDAFKETGNGLTGLQDKWDEYFDNIIKKQMLMRGVQTIIEPTLRTLDSMLSDGIMTEDEWQNFQKMAENRNEMVNEYLSKFADRYGVPMDSDESDLTGLQRGIQSITEETANALQALLNSIRFFVADNNTQLKIIAGSYNTEDTPNPMLAQLKVIAAQTTAIRNLLDSVTFVHPRGGRGFKVVI